MARSKLWKGKGSQDAAQWQMLALQAGSLRFGPQYYRRRLGYDAAQGEKTVHRSCGLERQCFEWHQGTLNCQWTDIISHCRCKIGKYTQRHGDPEEPRNGEVLEMDMCNTEREEYLRFSRISKRHKNIILRNVKWVSNQVHKNNLSPHRKR